MIYVHVDYKLCREFYKTALNGVRKVRMHWEMAGLIG
jgi:hypothetical protein